jgi:hypothetical protein
MKSRKPMLGIVRAERKEKDLFTGFLYYAFANLIEPYRLGDAIKKRAL